jgi:hypothetical protein
MTAETEQIEGMVQGDQGGDIDVTATGGEFITLPEDIYEVEFLRFEDGPEGQYGPSLRLIYGVVGGEYNGETIDELASMKGGPKSKLRQRAEAFLGRSYETGEGIRLVPLFGKRGRAVVKIHKTEQGGEFNRIESLMPMPAPRSAQRAAPAAASSGRKF